MPKYIVTAPDGREYEVTTPNEVKDPHVLFQYVKDMQEEGAGGAKPPVPRATQRQSGEKIDPDDLVHDDDFLNAASTVYRHEKGRDFKGTKADLVDHALQNMSDFNNNLGSLGIDAARLNSAPDDYKSAFLTLMDTYDNTSWDLGGVGRIAESLLTDPTTYIGAGTFGAGFLGTKTAGAATKLGVKKLLTDSLKRGATVGAIESAVYGAASTSMRQSAEVSLGIRDENSLTNTLTGAAIGAGIGGALGGTIDLGVSALQRRFMKDVPEPSAAPPVADPVASAPAPAPQSVKYLTSGVNTQAPNRLPDAANSNTPLNAPPITGMADNVAPAPTAANDTNPNMAPTAVNDNSVTSTLTPDAPTLNGPTILPDGTRQISDVPVSRMPTANEPVSAPSNQLITQGPEASIPTAANDMVAPSAPSVARQDAGSTYNSKTPLDTAVKNITEAVTRVSRSSGAALPHVTKKALNAAARDAIKAFKELGVDTADLGTFQLRAATWTPEQTQVLEHAARKANEEVLKAMQGLEAKNLQRSPIADDLIAIQRDFAEIDTLLSSMTGRKLGDRVGGFNTGKQRETNTVEAYVKSYGYADPKAAPDDVWAKAFDDLMDDVKRWEEKTLRDSAVKALEVERMSAMESGDLVKAAELTSKIHFAKAEYAALRSLSSSSKAAERFTTTMEVLREAAISSVFTIGTVTVNVLAPAMRTMFGPMIRAVGRGTGRAALKEMATSYYAMMRVQQYALKAGYAAFKYERTFLTSHSDKLINFNPRIPDIKVPFLKRAIPFGSAIRLVNRATLFSDEYFSRVLHAGHNEGNAAFDAMEQGMARGIKGKKLDEYVAKRVLKARQNELSKNLDQAGAMDTLYGIGVRKGYRDADLTDWVVSEMAKRGDVFRGAKKDSVSLTYVEDMLSKREFSGKGVLSGGAKSIEGVLTKYPVFALLGQLFFRTPIRVFEEGFRLTPGLNLVSPRFMADLRGGNGSERQIRTRSEAYIGMALGGSLMAAYASGNMTGSGPTDPKQRKAWEDAGNKPYTLKLGDGLSLNYRNLDPVFTPFKIISNALDRLQDRNLRTAQEPDSPWAEMAGEDEMAIQHLTKAVKDAWSVGIGAIGQAVRDANLMEGFDQLVTAGGMLMDPDATAPDTVTRFLMEKLTVFIPNFYKKGSQVGFAEMSNPVTITQFLQASLTPQTSLLPRQYDVLGNVRERSKEVLPMSGITLHKQGAFGSGKTDVEKFVLEQLSNIAIVNDKNFIANPKRAELEGIDLRKVKTEDGKTTLYDRWMKYSSQTGMAEELNELFRIGGTLGTKDVDGTLSNAVDEVIQKHREAAFMRLVQEDDRLRYVYAEHERNKLRQKAGERESALLPYR